MKARHVKLADFRKLGYCVAGMRTFCRAHEIDFRELAKNGVPEDEFIDTGDRRAVEAVARIAKDREAQRGR